MKILVWNECYISGGADWSLIDLITSWPSSNDKFVVYVNETHEGLDLIRNKLSTVAEVRTFPSLIEIVDKIQNSIGLKGRMVRLACYFLAAVLCSFIYLTIALTNKFDVLLLNNGGYPGGQSNYLFSLFVKLFKSSINFMIVRNYPSEGSLRGPMKKIYKWASEFCFTKVISVSDSLLNSLHNEGDLRRELLVRIYNGVNLLNKKSSNGRALELPQAPFKVGIIGSLEERKGHHILFRAWPLVMKECPEARIYVFGSSKSGDLSKLKELASELEIANNVVWNEFLRDIELAYQFLDVVAMPSTVYESFGRIIVEGMAYGKPVIASNVGGMAEIIRNGVDGFFFEPNNHEELARLIITLMKDPEMYRKITEEGKKRFERDFSSTVMAKNYYNFITQQLLQ